MKKILQRLFIPKPSTAILISIPLYVLVGAVLAKEITGTVAYFAYFLSSYALVITCIAIAGLIPSWKKSFLHSRFYLWLTSLPIIGSWITNDAIRIRAALYIGAFINLLYVILKIITGAIYHSAWLILFGLYYLFLVSMLSLEIAMTARFGAEDISFRKQMTALTGLGVCSIVLIMAVSMIIKSSTWFKQNHN
ncbi:hypothetical protein QYZ88_005365 [Lachnospiraceae bacterium C1.1]|nr:hypothetical protein [Lachnospiraceae bacterium C1.1]